MPDKERFLYFESPQIPLQEVPYGDLKANIINPTTGKPYKGMVLEGCFACLNQEPNNNNRIYSIPEYLELLEKLKKQIHSSKGVYGELEHPTKYSVDFKNVSHKILDVWWEPETNMVKGRILILNTPNGKIAQEIIKSGGQLAISARAAGDEIKQPNGTLKAVTKLLVTYDLVYHPGFSEAVLDFKELNESEKFIQTMSDTKRGFGFKIYQSNLQKFVNSYKAYINLNESSDLDIAMRRSMCYLEWFNSNLNEQDTQQSQQEVLQNNEPSNEDEMEQKLQKAVDKELTEAKSLLESQKLFFKEVSNATRKLRKFSSNLN